MSKEKSNYTFKFTADASVVDNIIKAWLKVHKFRFVNKYGEEFYYFNDPMLYGRRGFQYKIEGQSISINAWVFGSFGRKFYMLDSGIVNMVGKNAYKDLLQGLFNQISEVDKGAAVVEPLSYSDEDVQAEQTKYADTFESEQIKHKEKLCTIGFVLSIIGLMLSSLGFTLGLIIYLLNFHFAFQGLKTSKRSMAIGTIVLSVLSIAITIFLVVITV